ncbi:MAG: hypothetical protein R6V49_03230 [Bacteroidales bacterium]
MSKIYITVRIKPYLKDFLLHINGEQAPNGEHMVVASKKNITGFFVFPLLEKTPECWKPLKDDLTKLLTIELPYNPEMNIRCNNYVSDTGMRHFQSAIESIFLAEFYREVSYTLTHNPHAKIKDAIIDFCYAFGISFDNVNYEMLRKKYTRYRAMTAGKKKQHHLSFRKRYNRIKDQVS